MVRTLWKSLNHSAEQIVSVPSSFISPQNSSWAQSSLETHRVYILLVNFSFIEIGLQKAMKAASRHQKPGENLQYQSKVLESENFIVSSGFWFLISNFLYNHFLIKFWFEFPIWKFEIFDNAKFWQRVAYRVIRSIRFPDCK